MSAGFTSVDAINGATTAAINSGIATWIAAQHTSLDWVLINLGTNDLPLIRSGALVEATWLTNMGNILDSIHTKWPLAQLRLARVYRSDHVTEANLLDDTWITDVLATRGAFAATGPDERAIIVGHVSDTTHPDVTGYALFAAAWKAAMGY